MTFEVHYELRKVQLQQLEAETKHLIGIVRRYGYTGETLQPESIHILNLPLNRETLEDYYTFKNPKKNFTIHFSSLSILDNTLCFRLEVDPTIANFMVAVFGIDFGTPIPYFPIIRITKKFSGDGIFDNFTAFVGGYRPALTDMLFPLRHLTLRDATDNKQLSFYPLDTKLFVLTEKEETSVACLTDLTESDLLEIKAHKTTGDTSIPLGYAIGGATPQSITTTMSEQDNLEEMFGRFRLWYNRVKPRRLSFSDHNKQISVPNEDSNFDNLAHSATQTTSLLDTPNNESKRQHDRTAVSEHERAKRDLLTFVANIRHPSTDGSVNEQLDLLTGDEDSNT